MTLTKCPKCKGKGNIAAQEAKEAAVCSLGLFLPLLWVMREPCDGCEGKGYLKV